MARYRRPKYDSNFQGNLLKKNHCQFKDERLNPELDGMSILSYIQESERRSLVGNHIKTMHMECDKDNYDLLHTLLEYKEL